MESLERDVAQYPNLCIVCDARMQRNNLSCCRSAMSVPPAVAGGDLFSLSYEAMLDDITDFPLAYLITFRCYGTWLHGDERGSIDRHNKRYGMPTYSKTEHWEQISGDRMTRPPVKLTARMRTSVEKAIRETCKIRNWTLLAVNVRTNHVHVVVAIGPRKPSIALNALKANATRQMRTDGCWTLDATPWADKGSERYLWSEASVAEAVDYVINRQGDNI